jgi:hypothetical protein
MIATYEGFWRRLSDTSSRVTMVTILGVRAGDG